MSFIKAGDPICAICPLDAETVAYAKQIVTAHHFTREQVAIIASTKHNNVTIKALVDLDCEGPLT